ncbi:MAG TPA: sigma-70 family RNA polymerase sigma factor, partial [Turneriella sp.]|nr:sigma-70 family RNA polymerase sigma factor [Turneriella sp.]
RSPIQQMLLACTEGDDAAWDTFITLVQGVISGIGRKYVVNDVEDFCQNVYVLLMSNDFALMRRFKGDAEFELLRYIRSIAWREAKNQSRKNRVKERRIQNLGGEPVDATQNSDTADLRIVMNSTLMKLPFEEREILTLVAVGYKFREIADILKKPLNTVISKANRTQKMLKKRPELQ